MLTRNDKIIVQKMKQYLLPGVMLTAALQIGNIVDTMLVGNLLGPDAMSAVKIGMAVDNIIEIPGYVLGVGGSVAAGILMGNRETEKAKKVFSSTLMISVLLGLIFCFFSIWSGQYAEWLCGGSTLVEDARNFIFVTLLISPILSVALQMINYVAVDNNPALASAYVITANVLNLVLDYILLKYTGLGTAGAALSTGLGYGLALVLLIFYVKSKKRMLSFVNPFTEMKPSVLAALTAGIPTLLYMVFEIIKDVSLNTMIIKTVGETAMIIYTVCFNATLCVQLFAGGIVGLLSSMGSVLYGKSDYFGIRSLIKHLMRYSYIVLGAFMLVMIAIPEVFLRLFGVTEPELTAPGVVALLIYTFSLPFYLWNHFMTVYYQCTDKTFLSSLITSLQTCVVVVPAAFIFVAAARALETDLVNALSISFIFSEIATLLITYIYQRIKHKDQNYFMLPKQDENMLDFTVSNCTDLICEAKNTISEFCQKQKVSEIAVENVAAITEQVLHEIFTSASAKDVDVSVNMTEDMVQLRLMDNGVPFNPLDDKTDNDDSSDNGTSKIGQKVEKVEYLRVIDLNYLQIEINRLPHADAY